MTANLLTFISSKTKFLHIGLKQQLAKIQNCPLSTTHSARNLGFISDQITALSKSCNFHIRQHRCISRLLTIKTASTIATSIVHSKLDYCNSPYYNPQLTGFNTSRTFLFVQLLKLPSSLTPFLFSNLSIVNERIEYKILSLTYKTLSTA